jgi:hypothetical protein
MKRYIALIVLLMSMVSFSQELNEITWPREIEKGDYVITLYQPQLETLEGNDLTGRSALSIKKGKDEMIFGALWFTVRLETDKESRTAALEDLNITKIKFSDIEDETKINQLKEVIEKDIESSEIIMSLDRIVAGLESATFSNEMDDLLDNTAPDIYFRSKPTVLVLIDGEPRLKSIEKSRLEYVVNTPFFLVKQNKDYYLKGENHWYKSSEILSNNWSVVKSVPSEVEEFAAKSFSDKPENTEEYSKEAPDVIVVSEPSELIVTDGKTEYKPIKNTNLLYVTNTENDIILDINSQTHYILVNGRWYSSKTITDLDWSFVEPENLPKEFMSIPSDDSPISSVRISIPGTEEANEAMYEQYIPQTAKVDRNEATTTVSYDGEPKFEAIEGTKLSYALNTESTVLKVENEYYVVDDGVWFRSKTPKGPWEVSDTRPDDLDDIPPSSPVYNVKYVYIYDSTPEVVYVGYTPGYYHSYVYSGVVVYGTGYYYRPWYGYYYYPRPVTYGFGVHYNPYTGWGFSVGVSYGWFTLSFSSYSYWGPRGYAHGYRHGYYHGYRHGYHNGYRAGYARGRYDASNVYRNRGRSNIDGSYGRRGISTRDNNLNRSGDLSNRRNDGTPRRNDLGNRTNDRNVNRNDIANKRKEGNVNRNRNDISNKRNEISGNRDNTNLNRGNNTTRKSGMTTSNKRNNLYSDKNGNVYQRNNNGNWNQKRSTNNTNRNNTNVNRQNNVNRSDLNRQYNSRTRGNTRYNNYNSNRSSSGSINRGSRGGFKGRR